MDGEEVTFIPGLFKKKSNTKVKPDDSFVQQETLQAYCSIFSPDGVPSNIRGDPYLSEIIGFSEENLNDIAQVQIQREQMEIETDGIEKKKREQQEIAEQKIKKTLDFQVDKVFNQKAFFLKKQCPVKIPYKSSLTHEEHAAYLRAFVKFKMTPTRTAADAAEYENYLRLQHRVYEEQKNFIEFSHQVARLELPTYNTVPEAISKFIDEYVQLRSKRAASYEEHYVSEQHVPICPQDPDKRFTSLTFSHRGNVLSLGSMPQFIIPHKLRLHTLKIGDWITMKDRMAHSRELDRSILNRTPVSGDRNAEYLAQQHQAKIVISTSALKVLADNHGPNFDKEWDIPVEVKSYVVKDPDGRETQHRVAYIDKPLPKKTWTPLEKKQLYFKKAVLANFCKIQRKPMYLLKSPTVFKYSTPGTDKGETAGTSRNVTEYDDPYFNLSDMADSNVFGDESVESITIKSSEKRKLKKKDEKASPAKATKLDKDDSMKTDQDGEGFLNSSTEKDKLNHNLKISEEAVEAERKPNAPRPADELCDSKKCSAEPLPAGSTSEKDTQNNTNQESTTVTSDNFLDNLLTMQDSMLKPSQTQSETTKVDKGDKTSASNRFPQRPWTRRLYTDWGNAFEPHVCPVWTGKNVHYQLFSLESNSCQASASLQPIPVLVRSNLHGLSYFKADKEKGKTYVAYSKVESQAYFGCEVNTLSEITQQWVQLLVRPNTFLLQTRVCEGSGEILMTEERDLAAILREGKQLHVGFSPHQPLAILYSVFSALLGQPTGHYLLHHDPKTKAFIQLMKASNPNRATNLHIYSLHKAYASPSVNTRKYAVPPWLAIDTHVLSPFHIEHKKIPGTFPMNNPKKKFTAAEQRKKIENAKHKKSLKDLDKEKKEELCGF